MFHRIKLLRVGLAGVFLLFGSALTLNAVAADNVTCEQKLTLGKASIDAKIAEGMSASEAFKAVLASAAPADSCFTSGLVSYSVSKTPADLNKVEEIISAAALVSPNDADFLNAVLSAAVDNSQASSDYASGVIIAATGNVNFLAASAAGPQTANNNQANTNFGRNQTGSGGGGGGTSPAG